jgi:hypothetical protein
MKTLNEACASILRNLTHGLKVGETQSIHNDLAFRTVEVTRLGYFRYLITQGDTSMEFVSTFDGWLPKSDKNHNAIETETEFDKVVQVWPDVLDELIPLSIEWLKKIRVQQGA